MKRISLLILTIALGFLFVNFTVTNKATQEEVKKEKPQYHVPDDVQQIIDNSCYGCHNSDSKNEKGKKKLQFDKMADLKTYKQVGKLTDISDVVSGGDMPPKKFLENYPDRALSKEDAEKLAGWASDLAREMTPAE